MRVLYFAWVRERIGVAEEEVFPPATVETVADLIAWLGRRDGAHGAALADQERLRAAVDGQFLGLEGRVAGAVEVAIFPPVTGG